MEGKRIFAARAGRAGDGFLIESACDGAIVTTREQRSASAMETQRGTRGPRTSAAICRESLRSARGARVAAICRVLSRDCPEGIRPLLRCGMQTADTQRRRHLSHDTGRPLIAAGELSPITTPGCLLDDVLSPIHRFILASHHRASARDSSTGITISSRARTYRRHRREFHRRMGVQH